MGRLHGAVLLVLLPAPAFAHSGETIGWSFDPCVVPALAHSSLIYAIGVTRLLRRPGIECGVRLWQAACYATGWISPGRRAAVTSARTARKSRKGGWAGYLGNVGLCIFPFARAFAIGFAWAVNVRWHDAAGPQ